MTPRISRRHACAPTQTPESAIPSPQNASSKYSKNPELKRQLATTLTRWLVITAAPSWCEELVRTQQTLVSVEVRMSTNGRRLDRLACSSRMSTLKCSRSNRANTSSKVPQPRMKANAAPLMVDTRTPGREATKMPMSATSRLHSKPDHIIRLHQRC